MNKIIVIGSILLLGNLISFGQSNATDFNAKDCDGNSHNLFSELDAGKVIVIAWVMPCGSCISDPLSAHTTVQTYSSSHPGQVLFYLADDFANTNCGSLSGWASNYGMGNSTKFSDAAVKMSDYGAYGMPKIVVLAGKDHKVYFNKNSSASGIGASIDQALEDNMVGLSEHKNSIIQLNSFPNPTKNVLNLRYTLDQSSKVNIEVLNLGTNVVISSSEQNQSAGTHESAFDVSALSDGIYFLKVTTEGGMDMVKFVISN